MMEPSVENAGEESGAEKRVSVFIYLNFFL